LAKLYVGILSCFIRDGQIQTADKRPTNGHIPLVIDHKSPRRGQINANYSHHDNFAVAMPRIKRQTIFYPAPLPAPLPREIPVPPKYVRFSPGLFDTRDFGVDTHLPAMFLSEAEDPEMGKGLFTTMPAYPGDVLAKYGVEITRAKAKKLSKEVRFPLCDSNLEMVEYDAI
jgi:hypothetical protein